MLVGDRERDRPAPRPHVEHTRLREAREPHEAALHDDLGLGPRDEDARVDAQRESPESPLAQDVCERLAAFAARDKTLELPHVVVRQLVRRLENQLRSGRPQHVRDEDLGIDTG